MPYKEGTGYRAKVFSAEKGVFTKKRKTKREALAWEAQKRRELKRQKRTEIPMGSLLEAATPSI